MADRLARQYGTEEDKVNCPFYYKIGCCRHGDRCSRMHNKPLFSPTIALPHMYQNPLSTIIALQGVGTAPPKIDDDKIQQDFEDFYEEVFSELAKFGELEELVVNDNLGDHMVGNVFARYADEEAAQRAIVGLNGRFYGGRPLVAEFSPVTDFREARCRQFDETSCNRGGYCNFMHLKHVPRALMKELLETQPFRKKKDDEKASSRSHEGDRGARERRDRSRDRGDRDRDRGDRGDRDRDRRRSSRSRDRDRRRSRSRSRGRGDRDRRRSRSPPRGGGGGGAPAPAVYAAPPPPAGGYAMGPPSGYAPPPYSGPA